MEDLNQIKVFTLEEAEALLPDLTQMLLQLRQLNEEMHKLEVEIDLEEIVQEGEDSSRLDSRIQDYNSRITQLYALVDQIQEPGCFLKDADLGLIDFYSLRDGKVVYLCWKLGEERITHWHEVGKGFTSRQPI